MSPVWIDTAQQWDRLWPQLLSTNLLGFDLEGDFMLHRYGHRICLVQLSFANGEIWLIDTLAGFDLSVLWQVIADPTKTKVLWGGSNDVRVLKSLLGVHPHGLIDLWEVSRLIFGPKVSLPFVVHEVLGCEIQKDSEIQVSDWNQRPLTDTQRYYAAQDVRYLLAIWQKWEPIFHDGPQASLLKKRHQALEDLEIRSSREPWLRVKGWFALTPTEQERLKILVEQREKLAKERDLAPRRVESNEVLLKLAQDGQN